MAVGHSILLAGGDFFCGVADEEGSFLNFGGQGLEGLHFYSVWQRSASGLEFCTDGAWELRQIWAAAMQLGLEGSELCRFAKPNDK